MKSGAICGHAGSSKFPTKATLKLFRWTSVGQPSENDAFDETSFIRILGHLTSLWVD